MTDYVYDRTSIINNIALRQDREAKIVLAIAGLIASYGILSYLMGASFRDASVFFCYALIPLGYYPDRYSEKLRVRISDEYLSLRYFDYSKVTGFARIRSYFTTLKIYFPQIKHIEHVHFPDFFSKQASGFQDRCNRYQDQGPYSHVLLYHYNNPNEAMEGLELTLSKGRHIVFETNDVRHCTWMLKKATGLP